MRKVLPFLKNHYIQEKTEKVIFEEIKQYIQKYNSLPTKAAIQLSLESRTDLKESEISGCFSCLDEIVAEKSQQKIEWLIDETEKFCQEKAIYNAIMDSITIIDGKDPTKNKGSIPSLLSDALSISFDPNIGHDYIDNADSRYDYYHRMEKRIPFDLEYFNKISGGGLVPKALVIALAGCVTRDTPVRIRYRKRVE